MRQRRNALHNDSPFASWLLEQAETRNITLTELGRLAGLSVGTLRGITVVPGRQPTLDTCLRLARALGLSYQTVLEVAGLSPALPAEASLIDPDRTVLTQLYDSLPTPARRVILGTAQALADCFDASPADCTQASD